MGFLQTRLVAPLASLALKTVLSLSGNVRDWYARNGYTKLAEGWAGSDYAGVTVSRESAMRIATVLACNRIISESSGMLPLDLYNRSGDDQRTKAIDDPLYAVLRYAANPEMSAIDFRGTLTGHAVHTGNGFARVARAISDKNRVVALWPLDPDAVKPQRNKRSNLLEYEVSEGANRKTYGPSDIFHLRGFGFDGTCGYSMISYGRTSMGLASAADQYTAEFFAGDQTPGLVINTPQDMSPEETRNIKSAWASSHGPGRRAEPAVVGRDWKISRLSVSNVDMQFMELRKLTRHDICALFRVPPHMVADLERSTNNNIEWQGMEFVVHCLGPWLTRWEQAISLTLIPAELRARRYAEHNLAALLRGDTASRFAVYALARQWGIFNVDEIRAMENWNALPDGKGKIYLEPMNMTPVGQQPAALPTTTQKPTKAQIDYLRRMLDSMETNAHEA